MHGNVDNGNRGKSAVTEVRYAVKTAVMGIPLRGLPEKWWRIPLSCIPSSANDRANDYRYLLGWRWLLGWVLAWAVQDEARHLREMLG